MDLGLFLTHAREQVLGAEGPLRGRRRPGADWLQLTRRVALGLMLAGTVVMLPIILGYTAYVYWIFRGKIDPGSGYH